MIGALLVFVGAAAVLAGVRSNRRRASAIADGDRVACTIVGKKKRYDYDARGQVAALHYVAVVPGDDPERTRPVRVPVQERVYASKNVGDTIDLYGLPGWPRVLVHGAMPVSRRFGLIGLGAAVLVVGVILLLV